MRYSWQNRKEIVLYIKERKRFVVSNFLCILLRNEFSQSRSLESKFRFHTIRFFSEWHMWKDTYFIYFILIENISVLSLAETIETILQSLL